MTFRPLLREESLGSVSRRLKLSVRLKKEILKIVLCKNKYQVN